MTVPSWVDRSAWPYEPHSAPLGAGRLHYIDEGAGPVLLLVHGTPTWSFEWRHVVAGLRDTHRVLALDHLGFGLSDRPTDAGYSPEQHAQRFRQFMDLVYPTGKLTLVLHDFGGPIALDWTLDHVDRLSRLVIANSWMWSFADDPAMSRCDAFSRR